MKCYYTASSQVQNVPEFVVVTMVDDVQVCHYDSNIRRVVSKQDWVNRVIEDDPEFLKRRTDFLHQQQQDFKGYIEILKTLFNQSGGLFMFHCFLYCSKMELQDSLVCSLSQEEIIVGLAAGFQWM